MYKLKAWNKKGTLEKYDELVSKVDESIRNTKKMLKNWRKK